MKGLAKIIELKEHDVCVEKDYSPFSEQYGIKFTTYNDIGSRTSIVLWCNNANTMHNAFDLLTPDNVTTLLNITLGWNIE